MKLFIVKGIYLSILFNLCVVFYFFIGDLLCFFNYDSVFGCIKPGVFDYPKPLSYYVSVLLYELLYLILGVWLLISPVRWIGIVFRFMFLGLLAIYLYYFFRSPENFIGYYTYSLKDILMLASLCFVLIFNLLTGFSISLRSQE